MQKQRKFKMIDPNTGFVVSADNPDEAARKLMFKLETMNYKVPHIPKVLPTLPRSKVENVPAKSEESTESNECCI